MSPVTHFLTGWVLANSARLERRDRMLVTLSANLTWHGQWGLNALRYPESAES